MLGESMMYVLHELFLFYFILMIEKNKNADVIYIKMDHNRIVNQKSVSLIQEAKDGTLQSCRYVKLMSSLITWLLFALHVEFFFAALI